MSAVAVAIVGAAVVGGYATNQAAKAQEGAANEATSASSAASNANLQLQKELSEIQRADFAPWRDVGEKALTRIWEGVQSGEFEAGNIDMTQDPGYQFRLDQGIKARDASAASRGRLLSGAQEQGVTEYAQDYASNEYAKAYARDSDEKARKFNILSGLSAGGQASAAKQAQTTSELGARSGNILSDMGYSQAQGAYNVGNARAGAYTDTAQSVNQGVQNWMLYKSMNSGGTA